MGNVGPLIPSIGAACFGAVIGWLAHYAFWQRRYINVAWIASLLSVVGGGAVTAVFKSETLFGAYCIGMFAFFFLRMGLFSWLATKWGERLGTSDPAAIEHFKQQPKRDLLTDADESDEPAQAGTGTTKPSSETPRKLGDT
jgi:hypothetical protein